MSATARGRKAYAALPAEAQSQVRHALTRLLGGSTGFAGITHLEHGPARRVGVKYTMRASRALRILLNRDGAQWIFEGARRRGDKSMFHSER